MLPPAVYRESNAALARSVLVFNTGRSKGQLIWLLKEKPMLAVPDVLITAVGTKVRPALLLCTSCCCCCLFAQQKRLMS